jgi:hypothetical protein
MGHNYLFSNNKRFSVERVLLWKFTSDDRRLISVETRDRAFMLTVLARLTQFEKRKKSLLSCFRGSVVLHTLEHNRTDQIKCIVSQLQPARRC